MSNDLPSLRLKLSNKEKVEGRIINEGGLEPLSAALICYDNILVICVLCS